MNMNKKLSLIAMGLILASPYSIAWDDTVDKPESFSSNSKFVDRSNAAPGLATISETVRFIADQLVQNSDIKNIRDSRVAVTSILESQHLKEADNVGVNMAEFLIHELQIRGYKVIDYKLMKYIQVTSDSDHVMSRDVKKLKDSQNINYVVTGTYSKQANGRVYNIRLVDMNSGVIMSTAQAFIKDRDLLVSAESMDEFETQIKTVFKLSTVDANKVMIR
jgi:TolB-like protein